MPSPGRYFLMLSITLGAYQTLGSLIPPLSRRHYLSMSSTPSIPKLEESSLLVRRHTMLRLVARRSLLIPAISSRGQGYLYSWRLGAPFLKGLLSAYHFGNVTYPSQDPPSIEFLSTLKALDESRPTDM
ncbi:hypothetical protein BDZ89DRAFT_773399 [Hymenopellis radicata]|nr:hypothetical protein BDZ89DRAFT_773399 [Hymenopellis radicata]